MALCERMPLYSIRRRMRWLTVLSDSGRFVFGVIGEARGFVCCILYCIFVVAARVVTSRPLSAGCRAIMLQTNAIRFFICSDAWRKHASIASPKSRCRTERRKKKWKRKNWNRTVFWGWSEWNELDIVDMNTRLLFGCFFFLSLAPRCDSSVEWNMCASASSLFIAGRAMTKRARRFAATYLWYLIWGWHLKWTAIFPFIRIVRSPPQFIHFADIFVRILSREREKKSDIEATFIMCIQKKKKWNEGTNKWITTRSENNGKMVKMNDRPGMLGSIAVVLLQAGCWRCHAVVKYFRATACLKNDCDRKQCVCCEGRVENVCRARVSDIKHKISNSWILLCVAAVSFAFKKEFSSH